MASALLVKEAENKASTAAKALEVSRAQEAAKASVASQALDEANKSLSRQFQLSFEAATMHGPCSSSLQQAAGRVHQWLGSALDANHHLRLIIDRRSQLL